MGHFLYRSDEEYCGVIKMSSVEELTTSEKVWIVSFSIINESCTKAATAFQQKFNKMAPPRTTISSWKKKMLETGSLHDRPRSGRPLTDKNQEIISIIEEDDRKSQRSVAHEARCSQSTVQRVLKREGFKPYKFQWVQALNEEDYDRRLEFCQWVQLQSLRTVRKIIFSDECTFYLHGHVNKHNIFYYSQQNKHRILEQPIKSAGITVWAALSYDLGICFYIMQETLTKERYVEILQNKLLPFLDNSQEHLFQHDGAPPHFSIIARQWLDHHMPQRWIGRRGAHEWPPRSPDLSMLDFWLWSYVKDAVYSQSYTTLSELVTAIELVLTNLNLQMVRKCYGEFLERVNMCINQDGGHIEQFL